jgi:hypothetical protein
MTSILTSGGIDLLAGRSPGGPRPDSSQQFVMCSLKPCRHWNQFLKYGLPVPCAHERFRNRI